MPQEKGKHTFKSEARKQGGSLVTTIPAALADYLQLEEGDQINWQSEHSSKISEKPGRENGEYGSLWNETKQKGGEK